MGIQAKALPKISQELVDVLRHVFPPIAVEPNKTTIEEVMYRSVQESVIEWLQKHIKDSTVFNNREV